VKSKSKGTGNLKNNVYFIGLALVMLFTIIVVGCSNGGETKGSSFVIDLEFNLEETIINVQERVGKENEYKDIKLINIVDQFKSVLEILNDTNWENAKVQMAQPPHYKISFIKKGSGEEIETFFVWITPQKDRLEVVRVSGGYAKLTKKNSDVLFEVLTGVKNISKENHANLVNIEYNGGKTLEESMDYYIREIESSMGLSGAFFTGKYKIIDTEETSDMVNVYAHVVSRWVDTKGNTVSASSGVLRIGFKKENNLYIYKDSQDYKAAVPPYVPQKVSDIVSTDGEKIYNDLIEEIEKDIEKYLNPKP
jgi:hypothetical protein